MKSNLYNKIVFDEIYKGNISSNYFYKVGRELKIFSEYNNKLFYVESKIHRIMEDYAFNDKILWKKNPTGNVLYNKKNDTISLSDFNIENNFNTFLSDIPYFIALHFYKEMKKQELIEFSIDDLLSFISKEFFGSDLGIKSNLSIELLIDTPFVKELKNNSDYLSIHNSKKIIFSKNKSSRSFLFSEKTYFLFYIVWGNRHHFFKISKNI